MAKFVPTRTFRGLSALRRFANEQPPSTRPIITSNARQTLQEIAPFLPDPHKLTKVIASLYWKSEAAVHQQEGHLRRATLYVPECEEAGKEKITVYLAMRADLGTGAPVITAVLSEAQVERRHGKRRKRRTGGTPS